MRSTEGRKPDDHSRGCQQADGKGKARSARREHNINAETITTITTTTTQFIKRNHGEPT
jgi:hypothetical protein